MQLQEVSIYGFRSIEKLEGLSVGSPTVLAGQNDAGKSAVIEAVMMLLGGYQIVAADVTYAAITEEGDPLDQADLSRVDQTVVVGRFALRDAEQEQFGVTTLSLRRISKGGASAVLEVLRSAPENKLLRDYGDLNVSQLKDRLSNLELSVDGLKAELTARLDEAAALAPQTELWVKAEASLEKALPRGERFDAASAISAEDAIRSTLLTAYKAHIGADDLRGSVRGIEEGLEKKLVGDVEKIRKHIMAKVQDIGRVQIRPTVSFTSASGLKGTEITVTNRAGEDIGLNASGAGRARRIALAVWEYNSLLLEQTGEDVVLLYDEPDTHLDYGHQRELMHLIHEQTKKDNVTVVIASHSMHLIDGTDIGDVVHVKHEGNRTQIETLADETQVGSHLGAIAASVGLRNTVLLHERLFVGVEGDSEARALPVLFKLATGLHLESCGIALWPCGNNEGALRFASFLVKHGRDVAFLVDRDSLTQAKHIFRRDKLLAEGLNPDANCLFVGEPAEIEDLFTDAQWCEAANSLWPRDGEQETVDTWSDEDFAQHRSGKFSSAVLDMLGVGSSVGPGGKPEMLQQLALTLRSVDEVPMELRSHFQTLINRAR
ncbi:ATP-dependent endonuclease [Frigoribacterium sp. PhB107]|uniref:ATP-dependent nuclease n=1 Tax=Frigoribacterium sp. PhB107 TaxID=2485172 RepID=UPI000F471EB0|nr:TOPRIM nucleotidyl transferase/hydrolase domain-containing protein [Frigoribacterium sp. PhB107]